MNQKNKLKVKGTVVKVFNGQVEVKISKSVECKGCGVCLTGSEKILRLPAQQNLHEGDTVLLEIPCTMISKLSFLLYFIPAVFLITGFFTGYVLKGNLGGFCGALVLLGLSYTLIKKYSNRKYNHIIDIKKWKDQKGITNFQNI